MDIEGVPKTKQLIAEYVLLTTRHYHAVRNGEWAVATEALEGLIVKALELSGVGHAPPPVLLGLLRDERSGDEGDER